VANALENIAKDAAQNPKRAVVDGVDVESHPLPDLISAEKHEATKNAMKSTTRPGLGIRFMRVNPPGAF
jgi:hypothetical protein